MDSTYCTKAFLALGLVLGAARGRAEAVDTSYAFTNFAGTVGVSGTADGTGSAARFNATLGVAVDAAGNLFVADGANTVRKITPEGVVSTIAGSPGPAGTNDGTGASARFNGSCGVAMDKAGNIYVADAGNHAIRKINSAGLVTTLAGSPGHYGSANGIGSAARFYGPQSVAADCAGNVYVADTGNNTIRQITSEGLVLTLAGSPGQYGNADGTGSAARFNSPEGVATDYAGNVYVADSANNLIRKITPAGVVTTLAGNPLSSGSDDGIGSAATFLWPQGVAVDRAGNVYVAEETDDLIRRITPAGLVTLAGGSPSQEGSTDGIGSAARFYGPVGVAVDHLGHLYIADSNNQRITKGTPTFIEFYPTPDSLTVSNGLLHVWLNGPSGSVVIVESSANLRSWTPVQTNALPADGLGLSLPLGPNQYQFLRARRAP